MQIRAEIFVRMLIDVLRLATFAAGGKVVHLLVCHGLPDLPRHRKIGTMLGCAHKSLLCA